MAEAVVGGTYAPPSSRFWLNIRRHWATMAPHITTCQPRPCAIPEVSLKPPEKVHKINQAKQKND